jgi:putative transposase
MPRGDHDYSNRWSRIKAQFTKRYLALGGVEGGVSTSRVVRGERGVWQRRFYEHTVRDEVDLKRCIDYIHINPVKHKLTTRVRDWPWSSFHRYVHAGEYDAAWGCIDGFFGDEWARFE